MYIVHHHYRYPSRKSVEKYGVYRLVAGRMLEAFMAPCRIETTNVEAVCGAQHFKAEQTRIIEAGWHDVFMRFDTVDIGIFRQETPEVEKGDTLNVCGCNMVHKKQLPVNPFTGCRTGGIYRARKDWVRYPHVPISSAH